MTALKQTLRASWEWKFSGAKLVETWQAIFFFVSLKTMYSQKEYVVLNLSTKQGKPFTATEDNRRFAGTPV